MIPTLVVHLKFIALAIEFASTGPVTFNSLNGISIRGDVAPREVCGGRFLPNVAAHLPHGVTASKTPARCVPATRRKYNKRRKCRNEAMSGRRIVPY